MTSSLKILACRACIRDNPGEGEFATPESVEKAYREKLKEGWMRKTADFELHSCFAECENFHCVRVFKGAEGYHLKKISSPHMLDELVKWLREAKNSQDFELPEILRENLLYPIQK